MISITDYISEKLVINKDSITKAPEYNYQPKDREELKSLIRKLIKERGDDADLNDIDTSNITDMNNMFFNSEFNGDISKWNVSNVTNMASMFYRSKFNGDISKWDVSNVKDMNSMFFKSSFNKDISSWKVSHIKNMMWMFCDCPFSGDISSWKVPYIGYKNMNGMFKNSPLENNPPAWYK